MKRVVVLITGLAAIAAIGIVCHECRHQIYALFRERFLSQHFTAQAEIVAGQRYEVDFGPDFTLSLDPTETGWFLQVQEKGRSADLSRLTPPFHFVPNPREFSGSHYRNLDNTGPNDGEVNSPEEPRKFCFWPDAPRVGYPTQEMVASAFEFGSGELEILDYALKNLGPGQQAAFSRMSFRVTLSWPRGYKP